jgi:hypothetical protein
MKTQLIFVPWDSLSNNRIEQLPLKTIVHVNPRFSEKYMYYLIQMCAEHSKDMSVICYTVKPNKELVFFENF